MHPGTAFSEGLNSAFAVYPNPGSKGTYAADLTLSQIMSVCPGNNYSIMFDYRFQYFANNDCSLTIKYPYKDKDHFGSVIIGSAVLRYPENTWSEEIGIFQAIPGDNILSFVFTCKAAVANTISLDNVKLR